MGAIIRHKLDRIIASIKLEGTGIWLGMHSLHYTDTTVDGRAVYRGESFADLTLTGTTLTVTARNRYNLYDRVVKASLEVADDGKVSLHWDRELSFLAPHFEAKYQSRKASHLPALIPLSSSLTDVILHLFRVANPDLTFQG